MQPQLLPVELSADRRWDPIPFDTNGATPLDEDVSKYSDELPPLLANDDYVPPQFNDLPLPVDTQALDQSTVGDDESIGLELERIDEFLTQQQQLLPGLQHHLAIDDKQTTLPEGI